MGQIIEVMVRLVDGLPGSGREKGQIISVWPAGHTWGRREGPPVYGIIELELEDGETLETWKAKNFHRHYTETEPITEAELIAGKLPKKKWSVRSKIKLDIDDMLYDLKTKKKHRLKDKDIEHKKTNMIDTMRQLHG